MHEKNGIQRIVFSTILAVLVVIVILGMMIGCAPAPKEVKLIFAATTSASSSYPYVVALGNAVRKNAPHIQMTIVEGGGGAANWKGIQEKKFDLGLFSAQATYQIYNSQAGFAQMGSKDVRALFPMLPSSLQIVVRANSNIRTLTDLTGKTFAPSSRGTDSEAQIHMIMDALGIKPNYQPGTYTDNRDKFSKGNIESFAEIGEAPAPNIAAVAVSIPVRIIAMTGDQVNLIKSQHPEMNVVRVPPGLYPGQDNEILTLGSMTSAGTTKDSLTEDMAYDLVKTYVLGFDEFVKPLGKWAMNMTESREDWIVNSYMSPLHAGVIKYLREKGTKIPPELIPPEAK